MLMRERPCFSEFADIFSFVARATSLYRVVNFLLPYELFHKFLLNFFLTRALCSVSFPYYSRPDSRAI